MKDKSNEAQKSIELGERDLSRAGGRYTLVGEKYYTLVDGKFEKLTPYLIINEKSRL